MLLVLVGGLGTDMLKKSQGGFTIIEITIAIMILTAAVLGIAASTAQLLVPAGDAELEFQALQSVEERLALIRLDPRYVLLDSIYEDSETNLPGLTDLTRETVVTRRQVAQTGGKIWDYTEIVVSITGGRLKNDIYRKLILGMP